MLGLGIAGALGAIGGSVINAASQSSTNSKAMAFNSREAQKARDWNERMYNKYNSPIAQVQQYKAAGLNPNLLYGNGTTVSPVQSSAMANAGSVVAPRYGDGFDGAVQSVLNAKLTEAQIRNIQADTQKKVSDTKGQDINNYIQERSKDFQVELLSLLPDSERKEQALRSVTAGKVGSEQKQIDQFVDAIAPLQMDEIGARIRNFDASTDLAKSNKALADKETQYFVYNSETKRIEANASALNAKTNAEQLQIAWQMLPYQTALLAAQRNMTDQQAGVFFWTQSKVFQETNKLILEKDLVIKQGHLYDSQRKLVDQQRLVELMNERIKRKELRTAGLGDGQWAGILKMAVGSIIEIYKFFSDD